MDSPSPLDSDLNSELLAALDTLGVNKDMVDMEHDLVLEVPDTPDRLATRCTVNDSSRTSEVHIDLDGEFISTSSDWKVAPVTKIDAHHHRSSNVHEVASCSTAQDNNSGIRMEGSLTNTLNNKHLLQKNGKVLDSEQEKSVKSAGLCQQISSPISYPARCRDLRRKNGKEVLSQRKSMKNGGYTGLLGEELSQPNSSFGRLEHGSSFSSEVGVDTGNEERDKGRGKQIDINSDLQLTSEEGLSRQLPLNRPQKTMTQKKLVRNGFISPNNIAKSKISSKVDGLSIMKSFVGETCSLLPNVNGQDYKKESGMPITVPVDGPTKVVTRRTGHRKLVHNGCIYPNDIRHGKNVIKDDIVGKTLFNDFSDGNYSVQVHNVNSDSKNGWSDRRKGKEILDATKAQNVQRTKAEPQLDRECLKALQEVTSVTTTSDDTLGSAKIGQGALRDHKGKAFGNSFRRSANVSKREETIGKLLDQSHENEIASREGDHVNLLHDNPKINLSHHGSNSSMVCITSESESESGRRHRRQKQKAKRKCNSVWSQFGECSSLPLEGPEKSYIQSSTKASNPKSIRHHNTEWNGESSGPALEVDEINSSSNFHEESCSGYDDSSARLSQVESDEILARQLQEQFYHELPGFEGTEEIDARIAWSLHQEDARHVASARRNRSHPRDASMAHLFVHGPRPSFQSYSQELINRARGSASSRTAQLRRNFNSAEMDLEMSVIAELRRNFNSGEMDLETRLNFLEAVEAAFENGQDMEILDDTLLVQHEITEDDYEMLLALDDNNYQHSGASESQINSLPESVIQSNSNGEACAICLEPPAVGDVIRHLPCLHKFHKECIDTWLRRRTSCPVCKSGIS